MDQKCPICFTEFCLFINPPFAACADRQHFACICCYSTFVFSLPEQCHLCRLDITNRDIKEFRPFQLCSQSLVRQKEQNLKAIQAIKSNILLAIDKLVEFRSNNSVKVSQSFMRHSAINLMKSSDFYSAAHILKALLRENPELAQNEHFIGLGLNWESSESAEDKDYDWHEQRYGGDISELDLLAICEMRFQFSYQEKVGWYQAMSSLCPDNYRLLYGLTVTHFHANRLKQALDAIEKALLIDCNFTKFYFIATVIHLESKAHMMALETVKKVLLKEPNNIYALKMQSVANNLKGAQMRAEMQKILSIQPTYAHAELMRAMHLQEVEQKINAIEKCTQKYDWCTSAWIELATAKFERNCKKQAQQIFVNLLKEKQLNYSQRYTCLKQLGIIYSGRYHAQMSLAFFDRVIAQYPQKQLEITSYKMYCYNWLKQYQKAMKAGKDCIRRIEQAMASSEAEVELKYLLTIIYYCMASTQFDRQQYKEAIKYAKLCKSNYVPGMKKNLQICFQNNCKTYFGFNRKEEENALKWWQCCIAEKYQTRWAWESIKRLIKSKDFAAAHIIIDECLSMKCFSEKMRSQLIKFKSEAIEKRDKIHPN